MAEIGAVIAHLKALKEVRADRIGITGFCMGGRVTFLSACQHAADIKAAVAFYGGGIAADAPNAPLNFADKIRCPILCFFGETDAMIPRSSGWGRRSRSRSTKPPATGSSATSGPPTTPTPPRTPGERPAPGFIST